MLIQFYGGGFANKSPGDCTVIGLSFHEQLQSKLFNFTGIVPTRCISVQTIEIFIGQSTHVKTPLSKVNLVA